MANDPATVERDVLARAAEMVVANQFASPSMLRRVLNLDSGILRTLMEELERHGVVGPDTGSVRRAVLLPPQDAAITADQIRTGMRSAT